MTIRVSDHAVLRFLERARGVNVELVRKHIAELCEPALTAGALSVKVEGGKFALAPRTNSVTTFQPDSGMPNRTMHMRVRGIG